MMAGQRRGLLLGMCVVLVYVVWGTTYPAIRVMVSPGGRPGLPPSFAAGSRLLLAGLILLSVGAGTKRGRLALRGITWQQARAALIAGLLLSFGTGLLIALAAHQVESGLLATVMATSPLWTAGFIAASTRGLPRPRALFGLGLGISAVAFLSSDSGFHITGGIVLAFAAALTWGAGSWWTSRAPLPAQVWIAAGIGQVFSGIALVLLGAVLGDIRQVTSQPIATVSWFALGYLTCVSMTGFSAYSWLLTHANPLIATTHAFINPVIAALVGPLVLNERWQPRVFLSAALVGAAALLVMSSGPASLRRPLRRAKLPSSTRERRPWLTSRRRWSSGAPSSLGGDLDSSPVDKDASVRSDRWQAGSSLKNLTKGA